MKSKPITYDGTACCGVLSNGMATSLIDLNPDIAGSKGTAAAGLFAVGDRSAYTEFNGNPVTVDLRGRGALTGRMPSGFTAPTDDINWTKPAGGPCAAGYDWDAALVGLMAAGDLASSSV